MYSSFDQVREHRLADLEAFIHRNLGPTVSAQMTTYHLETGGKRLRGLIPLCVYDAMGHDANQALPLGAAVEMVHNATLVHDDLQDGDETRRNRPTVWKKYSPAQAINCGDAMFQYAFRLLTQLNISPPRLVRLIDHMAESTLSVIEGQAQEFVMKEEPFPGVERYLDVIRGKTSGLFTFPIVGAMEALAIPKDICQEFNKAAINLGMLFQIQDDLLDIYGNKGRGNVATDIAEGKISIFVAHVNDAGSSTDKHALSVILKKPRSETSSGDIDCALKIFERSQAKAMAISRIRLIQQQIEESTVLKACPEVHKVLIDLSILSVKPLRELWGEASSFGL